MSKLRKTIRIIKSLKNPKSRKFLAQDLAQFLAQEGIGIKKVSVKTLKPLLGLRSFVVARRRVELGTSGYESQGREVYTI